MLRNAPLSIAERIRRPGMYLDFSFWIIGILINVIIVVLPWARVAYLICVERKIAA